MGRPEPLPGISMSAERLRLVADSLPLMLRHVGADRMATYFNKPWLDFTGRSVADEAGAGWSEGVHPEDLVYCLDTAERAFQTQLQFEMRYRLRRGDGQYRLVIDRGAPLYAPDGSLVGFVGGCIDITDTQQAASDLEDHTEQTFFAIGLVARAALADIPVSWSTEPLAAALARVVDLANTGTQRLRESVVTTAETSAPAPAAVMLRQMCRAFELRTGIDTALMVSGTPRVIAPPIVDALRLVSEWELFNLQRGARPGAVLFGLRFGPSTVVLTVQHDAHDASESVGLEGVRQRLDEVGGSIVVRSHREDGGFVRARLPLRAVPTAVG